MRPAITAAVVLLAASAAAQDVQVLSAPSGLPAGARFGASLVVSGEWVGDVYPRDVIVTVGAPGGEFGGGSQATGAAYAYVGRAWDAPRRLISPSASPGDLFGFSVDRDPLEYGGYLVGAPGAGEAFHFHRSTVSPTDYVSRLDGSSLGAGSAFGYAVAGLAVGAPLAAGGGAVLVFPYYSPPGVPAAIPPIATLRPSTAGDSRFGAAVAHGVGVGTQFSSRFAVGSPGDGTNPGAVYIFRSPAHSGGPALEARIEGPPGFGSRLSFDLAVLVSTAPGPAGGPGTAHIIEQNPSGGWDVTRILSDTSAARFAGSVWIGGRGRQHGGPRWQLLAGAPGTGPDGPSALYAARGTATGVYTGNVEAPTGASGAYGYAVGYMELQDGSRFWAAGDPELGPGAVTLGTTLIIPVGAEDRPEGTGRVRLSNTAPHPVSGRAEVRIELPAFGPARLALFDVLGREVAVLAERAFGAGTHSVTLDARGLPPGIYVLRLSTDDGVDARSISIAR